MKIFGLGIRCSHYCWNLITSVFKILKIEGETRGEIIKRMIVVMLDVVSDPISSEGLRILFGLIFILMGCLFMFF